MAVKYPAAPTFPIVCLVYAAIFCSCNSNPTLFKKVSSFHSGIDFDNRIVENDSINPLDMEYLYNGGGVAVGDFNKDGLPDLYFTASTTSNKLYLNKGNLEFEDITNEAGVTGEGRWCNTASVVDINNDGWPDIYICCTNNKNPAKRRNLLYINQGLDKNGVPVFKEMAKEYGLDYTGYSVHAAFFDYDNDGDLDLYLVNTEPASRESPNFNGNTVAADTLDIDRLYRNDWNAKLHHPVFTDVSKKAGITKHGYGLGVAIADINRDGWKDIYVSNDFYSSDHLYINNHDGTFTDRAKEYFRHTSQNAMGNDMQDINNDGLADLLTVDMNPEDNFRKKKNMGVPTYYAYQNMTRPGQSLQYVRNTLQLNMGPVMNGGDSVGHPVFGDIGFMAGVAETDWSWNPTIADFDNDGMRDIIITNGYPRDVTDHDFANYRSNSENITTKEKLISLIPQVKIPNYAFKNVNGLRFANVTKQWGMDEPSYSSGAVAVDLDNDGDLDYVVNNINGKAFIYENTTNKDGRLGANYLDIKLKGSQQNPDALGAVVQIYYGRKTQVYENSPYRGYLSTGDTRIHFGLGTVKSIDSLVIRWPGNKKQVLKNPGVNKLIKPDIKDANLPDSWAPAVFNRHALFTDVTKQSGISYIHQQEDNIDFNYERLLPHKLSEYGPGIATADIDGDGLDDIFIGGTADYPGKIFLQQKNGRFAARSLPPMDKHMRIPDDMGVLLFDANGDGRPDLYCASGGNRFIPGQPNYQDRLYINKGNANFELDTTALPANHTSKSCIRAADFNNDGKPDIFIGGRVLPGSYPLPVSSFIYRNDSKNGKAKFTDVTGQVAPGLKNIGMVCDAIWTDFDNDGWTDLIVVGEWMPVTFFKNDHGRFVNVTPKSGISNEKGWWNSIVAGDFNNDGRVDYIVGNLGCNSYFRASHQYPVSIYAKDFDKNGSIDPIITMYLKNRDGVKKEFPAANRDEIIGELPYLRKKFLTYKDFGNAEFDKIFTEKEMKGVLKMQANNFSSCLIENLGNGKFKMIPLPDIAQIAPLNGMVTGDFNDDGNLDVAINGNDYGAEVTDGRYDAMNGVVLLGNGKGSFTPESIRQSGYYVPGNAKGLSALVAADGSLLFAATQNRGPLKLFRLRNGGKVSRLNAGDKYADIILNNGKIRRQEVYQGSSFLSQSVPFIQLSRNVSKVIVTDIKGNKRTVN